MDYKVFEKNKDTYFKYMPKKNFNKTPTSSKKNIDNPFNLLKEINFK